MNEINSNLYDLDMERSILSAILFEQDNLGEIYDIIDANDFYLRGHSDIFTAMKSCLDKDDPIDIAFVKKHLGAKYDEDVFNAVLTTNSILDIKKYATELREFSIKRALVKVAHQIPNKVNENKPGRDMVDEISSEIYSLVDGVGSGVIKNAKEIVVDLIEELNKQKLAKDHDVVGLDTGFRELNERTKGFKDGDLVIIAARPGMGKTTFVLNLVQKVLDQNLGVVFFSLEMPATQLMLRLLSAKTSINLQNLMTSDMDNDEIERLSNACDMMSQKKLFVYDSGNATIHQVRTQMRKLKSSHPEIKLCVIDYIGLMTNSSAYSDRHLQIAEISRGLKLLARELNLPVVALSQLNRSLESRANKRPMLSDLRESGAIEQDADTILFVYRNEVYLEQEENEKIQKAKLEGKEYTPQFSRNKVEESAEIIIGKNRNGPTGTIELVFQSIYTRFVEKTHNHPAEMVTFEG
mgnify:FL=1